jgi:hypothetical protein
MKSLSVGLAIIFCLLMSSTVNAECAWVMWMKTEKTTFGKYKQYPDRSVKWELIEAVPKFEQCSQRAGEYSERQYTLYLKGKLEGELLGMKLEKLSSGGLILSGEGWTQTIEWKCFPDTIDPRK